MGTNPLAACPRPAQTYPDGRATIQRHYAQLPMLPGISAQVKALTSALIYDTIIRQTDGGIVSPTSSPSVSARDGVAVWLGPLSVRRLSLYQCASHE